jgi:hypothetical protein
MELIAGFPKRNYHVSQDNVLEFERVILSDSRVNSLDPAASGISTSVHYFFRSVERISHRSDLAIHSRVLKKYPVRNRRDLFAVMLRMDVRKGMPFFFSSGRKALYLFDAWPNTHEAIRETLEAWKIEQVFVSSSQAADLLGKSIPGCKFNWIPEGVNPDSYHFLPYGEKDIDVLEFGRKYNDYHALITSSLERVGKKHLFEREKGKIVFLTWQGFVEGLARSKVSICFPSSLTRPEEVSNIETMTARYLQSMLSKCLIVGFAPREMIGLFGYDPVIGVDWSDPAGQLLDILDHFSDYIPLIEKNYEHARKDQNWQKRWEAIASVLFS